MGTDLLDGDVELTEFVELDVQSVKGVKHGANGFPPLLMKGLAVVKGARDCPKCDKSYDADHKGSKCENCGADLPDADASKAADGKVDCPTCKGDGKIMGNNRDCPDCGATGKVTPDKAKTLASKSAGPPPWRDAVAKAVDVIRLGQFPPVSAWAMIKAVDADGKVDEQPDIDGGKQAIALIAKLIQYEADELAAGNAGEACDIETLCCAVNILRSWMQGEASVQQGNVEPADMLMQSVMDSVMTPEQAYAEYVGKADMSTKDINDLPDSAFAYIEDGGKKDDEGKTTPRSKRHFPVHDKAHAENALSRAPQSPFGDKAMPKIKAAAKKFGIDTDTSKSRIAEEGPDVDTVTQGTGSLSKAVEDAVTKATAPLKERLEALGEELAKVKATPVPGGPVLSRNVQVKQPGGVVHEDWAAKAAYFRELAETVTDRPTADGYRKLAREADAKATAPATA